MCRVQQFLVPQSTQCTLLAVGIDHSFSESRLVNPLPYRRGDIAPSYRSLLILGQDRLLNRLLQRQGIIDRYGKSEGPGVVPNYEDRPYGQVPSGCQSMEVDQRLSTLHQRPKALIVPMVRVRASIPVTQQFRSEGVFVWTIRHRSDR